jgi:2-amino-4-hydroxy-6-hydroxymethyldihydropteridine diphosphokinase
VAEIAYVGLGSNVGDRVATLRSALTHLANLEAVTVIAASGVWETAPVGPVEQGDFLNAAAALRSDLAPRELLDALLEVERHHGRERLVRWGPRTLDLDLLLYGDHRIQEPGLRLPHPWLERRRFVLEPLLEIAPHLTHPVHGCRLSDSLCVLQARREERVRRVPDLTITGSATAS